MAREEKAAEQFFEELCAAHYENVLRYLFRTLRDESAARDTAQEVFLTACGKRRELMAHPNPGGWLFLTARNLAKKAKREAYRRMAEGPPDELRDLEDWGSLVELALDREIDETRYVEQVLSGLDPEKRRLYALYYLRGRSMKEIAAELDADEPAVRMRFVRLRREIRQLAAGVAEKNFDI